MVQFDETHLQLGKIVNDAQMPYEFKGINKNNFPVKIKSEVTCGCTALNNAEITLNPGETFSLKGYLKKRSQAVKTTKKIVVKVYDQNSLHIQEESLLFTMDLINKNDI